jgi:hypothetical protein
VRRRNACSNTTGKRSAFGSCTLAGASALGSATPPAGELMDVHDSVEIPLQAVEQSRVQQEPPPPLPHRLLRTTVATAAPLPGGTAGVRVSLKVQPRWRHATDAAEYAAAVAIGSSYSHFLSVATQSRGYYHSCRVTPVIQLAALLCMSFTCVLLIPVLLWMLELLGGTVYSVEVGEHKWAAVRHTLAWRFYPSMQRLTDLPPTSSRVLAEGPIRDLRGCEV